MSSFLPVGATIACLLLLAFFQILQVSYGLSEELLLTSNSEERSLQSKGHRGSDGTMEFNVVEYGAAGDGNTIDTEAFLRAWLYACITEGSVRLIVPEGKTFLLEQTVFKGKGCKATAINFQIGGKLVAPKSMAAWKDDSWEHWLKFDKIAGLTIGGGGTIDGQGQLWWKCKEEKSCDAAPAALQVSDCYDVTISDLEFVNSQGVHLKLVSSKKLKVFNLRMVAPEESPNAMGIMLESCKNVGIYSTSIRTGDDCITIIGASGGISMVDIMCRSTGHGISIGSLNTYEPIINVNTVHIKNVRLFRTSKGVSINAWKSGSGVVRNVVFQQIEFTRVQYPIVIEQSHCPNGECSHKKNDDDDEPTGVKIVDVKFIDVRGTTTSDLAINLNCDINKCSELFFKDVLLRSANSGGKATAYCINAAGTCSGNVNHRFRPSKAVRKQEINNRFSRIL